MRSENNCINNSKEEHITTIHVIRKWNESLYIGKQEQYTNCILVAWYNILENPSKVTEKLLQEIRYIIRIPDS